MVLDSISHQSKLDPFTLSPPSQSEEPTENIWGVFTPAALWQLHRGNQNQWMLQGWGQFLGHSAVSRWLEQAPGCLFWEVSWEVWRLLGWQKSGALSRGQVLLGGARWFRVQWNQSMADSQRSVLLLSPQPQQQRHKKCPYQGWSFHFLMWDWHLE